MIALAHGVSVLALLGLGIFVGFVAGLFGVGGGFLLTPLLSVVLGLPPPIAVGTGLCQMVGTATAALLRHRRLGQGELRMDCLMLAGSLLGVSAGAASVSMLEAAGNVQVGARSMPLSTLVIYGGYLLFLAVTTLGLVRRPRSSADTPALVKPGPLARLRVPPLVALPRVPPLRVSAIVAAYLGLALGFVSGLLGVGGGVALLPVLLYGYGFPIRQAAGTGILVLLVTALHGTFLHARAGHVDLPIALTLLAGASISAQFGALATHRLRPRTLRLGLAGLVLLTLLAVAVALISRLR
ncbi:MAG: sulfite exporter TauE/SafE family protein [Polyangiaceae bacterium]